MKLQKIISLFLALLLIAAVFAGCKKKEASGASDGDAAPEGIYITVDGTNLSVGIPFADVKDKLGAEVQPAEELTSCDENSDWRQTQHFFEKVTVAEDKDGIIDQVLVLEGDALLMGKVGIGATKADVIAVLGEPPADGNTAWGLYYDHASVMLDEETGIVTGFILSKD